MLKTFLRHSNLKFMCGREIYKMSLTLDVFVHKMKVFSNNEWEKFDETTKKCGVALGKDE
jgi:hypothetical protein